ncbi:glycosyltransferase family 2 protein [Flavobacterium sp. NRK F7]|uniref:glycosyltransferase family 2 protein n=1 Tax=Flavobacterium sp. NRK F7 TaxID=2954930 RepID=UPI0020910B88|nr:glycosyltransferase family 2 protein [Flavobacterium sp. NRK F7]MCO6163194.1 glycosyltransferase family 2 protein [Flavobacterium sp. NRK F7]
MLDLSIIIINYNTSNYTIQCVESIIKHTSTHLIYNIIIVDNHSKSNDYNALKNYITELNNPSIKLLRNHLNTGFGGGNMIGCQFSDATYYAFVNNDSLLLNDCFSIIIEAMKSHDNFGICGPQSFKEDGSLLPTLDHFSSPLKELFGRYFLEIINPKKYPKRKLEYKTPQRGQFVSGSFMVVRSEDFWSVGGFDTNIFLYQEETDLCIRLAKIKKYAYLIPNAKFIHFHGASTPKSIAIKTELKISLLYVIRKHYGYLNYRIILLFLQIKYFIKSIRKPKYWPLFKVLFRGGRLNDSLKHKQNNKE